MTTRAPRWRVLCFSSGGLANLRAAGLIDCLRRKGYEVVLPPVWGTPATVAQLILSLWPNLWYALTRRADLAVGFKPHPNVTLPLLLCKLRGIRTWIDVDDLDHAYREGFLSKVIEYYEKPFPRLFDVASYHNPKLKAHLVDHLKCAPQRLLRIPQGVNFDFFHDPPESRAVEQQRDRLNVRGKRVAVYTAHMDWASDLPLILQAWRRVVDEIPEAYLLAVGGGPRLPEFRELAQQTGLDGQVFFSGEVSHSEVRLYVALAEVALLYYSPRLVNQYRCSLKLREYFAAGLKVICNDVGELPEFAGVTYQVGTNVADFARAIAEVVRGGGDGREKAGQAYARQHLHWPCLFDEVEPALVRLLFNGC